MIVLPVRMLCRPCCLGQQMRSVSCKLRNKHGSEFMCEIQELESLPPTIGQLKKLQSLLLAGNPLGSCSLRAVVALHMCLSTLDLSGTERGGTDDDSAGLLPSALSVSASARGWWTMLRGTLYNRNPQKNVPLYKAHHLGVLFYVSGNLTVRISNGQNQKADLE